MKWSAVLVLALVVAGCRAAPSSEVEVSCGPLDAAECRAQADVALAYVDAAFAPGSVRRLEFVDAGGGYTITFADGTQAGITP